MKSKIKIFQKLTTAVLSLTFVANMTPVIFGDVTLENNGVYNNSDPNTDATILNIPKGIKLINKDNNDQESNGEYYIPEIIFTYSIAPEATLINNRQDGETSNITVKTPPQDSAMIQSTSGGTGTTGTVKFDPQKVQFSQELKNDLKIKINLNKFTESGIYRYKITDTTQNNDLFAKGIIRSDNYNKVRYLDVGIADKSDGQGKYVAAYALRTAKSGDESVLSKSPGYIEGGDGLDNSLPDKYISYNVKLTKKLGEGSANTSKKYGFDLIVDNVAIKYIVGSNEYQNKEKIRVELGNNDSVEIKGLSSKAKVKYEEDLKTEQEAGQTFTVKAGGKATEGEQNETEITVNSTEETGKYKVGEFAITNYSGENISNPVRTDNGKYNNVIYTNTELLTTISFTGVVLDYAPYILIFVFAVGLIVVFIIVKKKSKETDNNEDNI